MDVLQLDVSGRPQAWITTREAAVIYASDGVAWTLGDPCQVLRGGLQRVTGQQSRIELHSIIAVRGAVPSRAWRQAPALTNSKLFVRDRFVCAYCGHRRPPEDLTREHIHPTSRGGQDSWMNCITACRLLTPESSPVRVQARAIPVGIEVGARRSASEPHEFASPVRRRTRTLMSRYQGSRA